jgi:hypothetical protein
LPGGAKGVERPLRLTVTATGGLRVMVNHVLDIGFEPDVVGARCRRAERLRQAAGRRSNGGSMDQRRDLEHRLPGEVRLDDLQLEAVPRHD